MTVGERIQLKREELGLSQSELAKRMGYAGKSAVSRAENSGDDIGANRIVRFADALNTTPSYLMGWEETEQYKKGWDDLDTSVQAAYQSAWEESEQLLEKIITHNFGEEFLCLLEINKLSPEGKAYLKDTILLTLRHNGIDISKYL